MNLSPSGSDVANSSLIISCRVTVDEKVVSNLTLIWMTSDGVELQRTNELSPATGGSEASLDLSLDPLNLIDAGLYNCTAAAVDFNGETLNITELYTLTVAGTKLRWIY